ncbi:heme-degrading domain-containing protein [Variovorax sp. J22R133]|uniref:heme-degrading domain-containing protein n=1 Tax=Variovorax brevis TaxID=3053503 RepID=UPI002577F9AB|nr:heme-degrading domain-containing protein [Variovorax sp. J22R133]MDM0111227.1 heme-degrading domain-containing protein [Variovorax sp. J22R133]
MSIERDLERMALQEQRLRFVQFDNALAWELGTRLRSRCEALGTPMAIEIRLARETVFFFAMPGTNPGNADWARRKRNTVELLHRSSYAVGMSLELEGRSLEQQMGLPARDHAVHGGSFPIRLSDGSCVGAVTVSGAPQREDHNIVVRVLAELCDVPPDEVTLA